MAMQLDHVILLLPYKDILNPPDWLTKHFIVSPGGVHADGKTENRLVLFRDGTYLELIAFIDDDPERRTGHWWDKPYGVVDYALTSERLDYESLITRLKDAGSKISYQKPLAGGRKKPDGTEIKWEVTFPIAERGSVPFFCHDVTPRDRRVPVTDDNTNHPSGALGMAGVLERVGNARLAEISTAISAIVDEKGDGWFQVGAPHDVESLAKPSLRLEASGEQDLALGLVVQVPEKPLPDDIAHKIDNGVVSILFERPKF